MNIYKIIGLFLRIDAKQVSSQSSGKVLFSYYLFKEPFYGESYCKKTYYPKHGLH